MLSAVPYEKLLETMAERICDQPVLMAVHVMLRAWVMGNCKSTKQRG